MARFQGAQLPTRVSIPEIKGKSSGNSLGCWQIGARSPGALFFSKIAEDFSGVTFRFDRGPDLFDFAVRVDEERTTSDAHEGAAHELLFLPGSELFDGCVSGIAKQREVEILLGLKRRLGLHGIGAKA